MYVLFCSQLNLKYISVLWWIIIKCERQLETDPPTHYYKLKPLTNMPPIMMSFKAEEFRMSFETKHPLESMFPSWRSRRRSFSGRWLKSFTPMRKIDGEKLPMADVKNLTLFDLSSNFICPRINLNHSFLSIASFEDLSLFSGFMNQLD